MEDKWEDLQREGVQNAVVDWLNCTLDNPDELCKSAEWDDIHMFLRDGTRLCTLATILRQAEGRLGVSFSRSEAPFVCMDNIGKFLKAAEEYGVKKSDLFQVRAPHFLSAGFQVIDVFFLSS